MALSRSYQITVLCGVVMAVYYSALFSPICLLDDSKLIFFDVADAGLRHLITILFSGGGYYRPLLGATFILDNYLWMLEESFLHLENVLLHGANALLLYSVTERLAKRSGIPASHAVPFITALLFILHPLATESVNWISGRTDPLACLFLLLSFKILIDWIDTPTVGRIILVQLCYLLACLSKETAVFFIVPAALLVMVMRVNADSPAEARLKLPSIRAMLSAIRTDWLVNLSFAAMTVAYFALRRYASMSSEGRDRGLSKLAKNSTEQSLESVWFDKIMEVFRSIGFYTKKIFAPWPLNFNIVQVSDWYVPAGLASVILLAFFCWRRRDLVAALLLSAFLIGSSALLVSVGKLAWTAYAERYLYIPLIFFIPASVLWLHEKTARIRDGQFFRIIIIGFCGASLITTVQRNLLWMDSASFYKLNYEQAPDLRITVRNYAVSLQLQGMKEEARKIFILLPPKKRSGTTSKPPAS